MALDFPSSPTNGQTYDNFVYDSVKGAWRAKPSVAAQTTVSPTPPTSSNPGDLWFNSNEGLLYVRYSDGNSTQWVEVKANSSLGSTIGTRLDALEAKPSGLVPIIPSTIAVSGGTATANTSAAISFSGVTSIALNNVFTSTYDYYRIIVDITANTVFNAITWRLTSNGTVNTTGYNHIVTVSASDNTTTTASSVGGSSIGFIEVHPTSNANYGSAEMLIIDPANDKRTKAHLSSTGSNSGGLLIRRTSHVSHSATSAFDGFVLTTGSGTMDGKLQIYGYR